MIDTNTKIFTIYNVIPSQSGAKYGHRFFADTCSIQTVDKKIYNGDNFAGVSSVVFFSKDLAHYLSPLNFYKSTNQENFFTISPGDFIVFDKVEDVISTSKEFNKLKEKYQVFSMTVATAEVYTNGLATDHIEAVAQ